MNAIGAYFPDSPLARTFRYESFASQSKYARSAKRKTPEEVASSFGLTLDQVSPIDAERFIAFVWKTPARPEVASND